MIYLEPGHFKNEVIVYSFPGQSSELLEDCQKLLDNFNYPWEMMPLMYVILKDAHADMEEARRRIEEGNLLIF